MILMIVVWERKEGREGGRTDLIIRQNNLVWNIINLLNLKSIDLDSIEVLVFDEADKLLEMGFLNNYLKI